MTAVTADPAGGAQHHDEERRAEERGDHADRDLGRGQRRCARQVGEHQERAAEQQRQRQDRPVAGAGQQPHACAAR